MPTRRPGSEGSVLCTFTNQRCHSSVLQRNSTGQSIDLWRFIDWKPESLCDGGFAASVQLSPTNNVLSAVKWCFILDWASDSTCPVLKENVNCLSSCPSEASINKDVFFSKATWPNLSKLYRQRLEKMSVWGCINDCDLIQDWFHVCFSLLHLFFYSSFSYIYLRLTGCACLLTLNTVRVP